jgi:hypothetical protein
LSSDERHLFALDGANDKLWRYHLDVMWPGELVATLDIERPDDNKSWRPTLERSV